MNRSLRHSMLGAAVAFLVAACSTEPPNAVAGDIPAQASSQEALARAAAPPVTGQPSFIRTIDDPRVQWGPCPEWMPAGCELAVIQGLNPDGTNADAFFKLLPGSTVVEHWHTSAERMVLLSGIMEVDYDGQDPVTLLPGTYAYGPAELPHETHCLPEGGENCILFIAFEEPLDAIEGLPETIPDEPAFIWTPDDAGTEWGPCPEWMPTGCELAVIQALDPEGRNADALFKLAAGTKVPLHWHTSAERMVLLSGEMRVNYQGQPPTDLDPFTYAYGPAGLPHDTTCEEGEDCILYIAFEEPVDAIDVRGGNLPHQR